MVMLMEHLKKRNNSNSLPPPEDPGNPMAKFSKDEVSRNRSIL